MNNPEFTIVIPTRNRLASLKSTLRTCLSQDYPRFSIIVASNACVDGTDEYVACLRDDRVTLVRSDSPLRMTENWSRVMPMAIARGGFITYLGDDDGLLPGALELAADVIRKQACKVLSWRKVEYAWPTVLIDAYRNYFSISTDKAIAVQDAEEFLRRAHDFTVGYDEGPGLYSSFVHAQVLADLMPATGDWFAACSPDIYSCYTIASAVRQYHKCKFGLSINGASGSSNGMAYMHRPKSDLAADFTGQNPMHPALEHAPSIHIAEADGLLVSRERFPDRFARFEFAWPTLVSRLADNVGTAPSQLHHDLLVTALRKVAKASGQPVPETPPHVRPADVGGPVFGLDPSGSRLTIQLDPELVPDVHGATLFANSVFPLSGLQREGYQVVLPQPADADRPAEAPDSAEVALPDVGAGAKVPAAPSRVVRGAIRRARMYRRWLKNAQKIESWFAREPQLLAWARDAELIDATLLARNDRLAQEEAARGQFETFRRLSDGSSRPSLKTVWSDRYLCLDDGTQQTGFDRHYVYHPAWAARVLARTTPRRHTDISSTLAFCSLVSAFIPVDFYDYRPAPLHLPGLNSMQADLLTLPFRDDSLDSVSCMHVLEHIGLGRYGDPLDAEGDLKAIRELCRVVARGGSLLVAVPVGQPRVQFNAHRVYQHREFQSWFKGLELVEFALIPDGEVPNGLLYEAPEHIVDAQVYGCGCYWFRKPA
jgi:SAM-dependent methyltransferase